MRRISTTCLSALLALLAGCGFEPLYGQRPGQAPVAEQLSQVRIGEIRTPVPEALREFRDYRPEDPRSRYILKNYLLDDLTPRGAPTGAGYVLNIELVEPLTNIAVDRADVAVRYAYSVIAYFNLLDSAGRVVHSGASLSSTTFEASPSEFATISSQRDARERLLQEVSGDIRNQLALYFLAQTPK